MPVIERLNDTTYEAIMLCGDKVEIGDREAVDFKPCLKLNRWGDECFLKVSLPTKQKQSPKVEGGKVKWAEQDIEAYFYPVEPRTVIAKGKDGNDHEFIQNELGGFEFEIILKKKPKTNQIVLNIELQGLRAYYQPPLTPEEIAEGCIRPENVEDGIAFYHATRTNMHRSKTDAEKYKDGNALFAYRPKVVDAVGKWIWGELSLDEKAGTLTTTIPQDFLDKAVYPISTGTTNFGYETAGGSYSALGLYGPYRSQYTMGATAGTGISMSAYLNGTATGYKYKYAVYSGNNVINNGTTNEGDLGKGAAWQTQNFTNAPSLSANTAYNLAAAASLISDTLLYYNNGGTYHDYDTTAYASVWPDPWSADGSGTRRYSIYCTYEETPAVVVPTVTTQAVTDIEKE